MVQFCAECSTVAYRSTALYFGQNKPRLTTERIHLLADQELAKSARYYARPMVWVALLIFASWAITDWLHLPDRALALSLSRLVVLLLGFQLVRTARVLAWPVWTPYACLALVTVHELIVCLFVAPAQLETVLLNYGTLLVAYGLIMVWRPIYALLSLNGGVLAVTGAYLVGHRFALTDFFSQGSIIFLSLLVTTSILSVLRYNFHRREVIRRVELKLNKEQLERQNRKIQQQKDQITRQHAHILRSHNELEVSNRRLQALDEEKNHLINIVAHDLRSPLARMIGLTNLVELSAEHLSQDQRTYLSLMKDDGQRLLKLIAQLLDTENFEAARGLRTELQALDPLAIWQQLASHYAEALERKSLRLQLPSPAPDFPLVVADAQLLHQVLDNLLSNAIKYSPAGRSIRIECHPNASHLHIRVCDQGPGLTSADQQRLFGRFQRLSARPTGGESSHGLGLSIVKQFTEAMHGRVWCESIPGQGATFIVSLPLAVSEPAWA